MNALNFLYCGMTAFMVAAGALSLTFFILLAVAPKHERHIAWELLFIAAFFLAVPALNLIDGFAP